MTNEAPITEVSLVQDNPLNELVGEGKKYKTPEELAKAYKHADDHIKRVETENTTLREQQLKKVDEVLEAVKNGVITAASPAPSNAQPHNGSAPSVALDEDAIKSIVTSVLVTEKTQTTQKQNRQDTLAKLSAFYGSEELAKRAINKVASESPSLKKTLDDLAFNTPDAAIKLVTSLVNKDAFSSTPPLPGAQPSAVVLGAEGSQQIVGAITWSAAQKLRRENPAAYNSAEFQSKLVEAADKCEAQGKNFYQT